MKIQFTLVILLFQLLIKSGYSEGDTLRINLAQADSILINHNLSLIAKKYDIDAAQVVQSRLFSNPVFSTELSLYNPESGQWFDPGQEGVKSFVLDQVFRLAGQRNASIKLAKETVKMTEAEYADLARTLKFQLHQSFFSSYYLSEAVRMIQGQLNLLETTIKGYREQYLKGNVSLKDYSRLEAAYMQLNRDQMDMISSVNENMKILQVLLGADRMVIPAPGPGEILKYSIDRYSLAELVSISLANRPDLQVSNSLLSQQQYNLSLQKRLAIPDLTLGVRYDPNGNNVKNYNAVTASIPIPVFHRNQGNISMASALVEQAKSNYSLAKNMVVSDVESAYKKILEYRLADGKTDPQFIEQINELSSGIIENYKRKNISMLEFTDMFDAYTQAVIDYYQLKSNYINAYEELNYAEGFELYK